MKQKYKIAARETTVTDVVIMSYSKCMCRTCSILLNLKFLSCFLFDKLFFFPSLLMWCVSHQTNVSFTLWKKGFQREWGWLTKTVWNIKCRNMCRYVNGYKKRVWESRWTAFCIRSIQETVRPLSFNSTAFRVLFCDFHSKGSILV